MDYFTKDAMAMASVLKNVLIRINEASDEDDKLMYAAEYAYISNIMLDMLQAFTASTDKKSRDMAIDLLDKTITKQLFSVRYGSGSGTPSA